MRAREVERAPERIVLFRPREVLKVVGLLVAVVALLYMLWIAKQVLTWLLVAVFLAIAFNPAVAMVQRRGIRRRGPASAVVLLGAVGAIIGIGALFVPPLVDQVREFADAVPGYIDDLTKGRGPFGFLETKYHIVEKAREALESGGASRLLGLSGTVLAVTKGVLTAVLAVVTIAFATFFLLLEGPGWVERFYGLLPEKSQPRWRGVGRDIYRTIGGYVTGNLLISLVAGVSTSLVLLVTGVPYWIPLGLLVAILDLIPLAGATIAGILIGTVAFLHSITAGIVVVVFFVVYQQIENHVLQPVVYGRTVKLSPLIVLIAVLLGAEIAGVLGALGAIPIAGSIQVLLGDWFRSRRERRSTTASAESGPPAAG